MVKTINGDVKKYLNTANPKQGNINKVKYTFYHNIFSCICHDLTKKTKIKENPHGEEEECTYK